MIKFAILTLGCKVNLYESENYVQSLKEAGYIEVAFNEQADIYVINTCTVTNTASSKSRQKINQARKQNPKAVICAVGCLVQIGDENLDDIDIMIGSAHKDQLVSLINKALSENEKYRLVDDVRQNSNFDELYVSNFTHHTRAFLKIQDGCDQFCAYCIIPYARGKERSLAPDKVIEQAKKLLTNGHKEIVLSGIHTGRYGKDHQTNLTTLIKQLLTTSIYRLRISSIEITEITDEMILLIKEDDRLAKHLHIPLQSGCDKMLTLMKRPYDTAYFLDRIRYIQQMIPDISISTDVIVGFPGESEEDFMKTLSFIKEVNFSFLHVFPYSKKSGTVAAQMADQISKDVKRSRVTQLISLSNKMYEAYQKTFLTKKVDIIMEAEKEGKWMGHSSHYLPIEIDSDEVYRNKVYNVSIMSYENLHLLGKIVEV